MKFCKLKIQLKWLTTWLSVATLVMSPVALGKEAEKISKQQVVSALKEMGLDKQITVGEFFENTKGLYPERIRSQIEPVIKLYKNVMMPKFEVTTAKGANGIEIPTVRVSQNGQILNLQFFGEQEKFVKFQNTNLSEVDIINFNDMFERIIAGDEVLRKQIEVKAVPTAKTFTEFPKITKEFWNRLTAEERANYMIHLRLLWSDSKKVLTEAANQKKSGKARKTSALEKSMQTFENYLQVVVPPAEALPGDDATNAKKVNVSSRSKKAADAAKDASASDCLVAGYVTSYNSRVCDHKNIKAEYLEIPVVKKANAFCGVKKLACNPIVFGTPNGEPICITPGSSQPFQIATHYDGPCETINGTAANRLGTNVEFLKDPTKKQGRYAPENLSGVNLEADAKKFQEPTFAETQSFLEGMLKFNGKSLYTDGAISETTLAEIITIKNHFDADIAQATASCKASSESKKDHEPNFWQACDQLQRRFLFVAEFFQKKCPTGSLIDPATLKCACGTQPPVTPGSACKPAETAPPAQQPPPATKPPPEPPTKPPVAKPPGGCPVGTVEKITKGDIGSDGEGAEQSTCEPIKDPKKEPGMWDKILKGLIKVAPFAFAGLAIFAMYKLFKPKKVGLNSAGDFCPNGVKPPCGQMCPGNLAQQANGQCGCSACPPGQTITDQNACTCGSGASGGAGTTTQVTCWDGSKANDLASCPKQKYPCWDGSLVENALNCPEKPPTVTPKTGVKK